MDAKSLREAMKEKAKRLSGATSEKVDASTWTPDEPLNADVKTGMRPVSRRAFKVGGKVEGAESMSHAGRTPRKSGGALTANSLINRNDKDANEEREGKKHVGGFKKGGTVKKAMGGGMEEESHKVPLNQYGKGMTQKDLDTYSAGEEQPDDARSKLAPAKSPRPMARPEDNPEAIKKVSDDSSLYYKRGGKAEKFEGSAKDQMQDKKLAAKRGMSMKDWEKSDADDKHDSQKSMKGLKSGGKAEGAHKKGCTCKACGGVMMGKKDGGGLYANINAKRERGEKMRDTGDKGAPSDKDFKDAARTARKSGGKVGKSNISINIFPHNAEKAGAMPVPPAGMPPMPPMGGGAMPPPMMNPPMPAPSPMPSAPPPAHMSLPPSLMATMSGAAGAAPRAGPNGPPPPMGRKAGGKVVYPITGGAGGGRARLEKIAAYGEKMNKDLKK